MPNGNIKSYGINISGTYTENVSSTHSDKFDEPAKPKIKEYSRILKLRPSHEYTIKVAANSNSSTGEWTPQTFTTPSLCKFFKIFLNFNAVTGCSLSFVVR